MRRRLRRWRRNWKRGEGIFARGIQQSAAGAAVSLMMMTRRAYSYIRFSTPAQALGDSLRRQIEATEAYCAKHCLELDESLRDEGFSGYHGAHKKKGALGRFLERVKNNEIAVGSVLIVEAFDRLSRQTPREALNQFLDLINNGIAVVTLIDEQRFDKASVDANVSQLFMSIGMMMGAHAESRNKGVRVKAAWIARRRKVSATCPAWLKPNADRTAYDIIDHRKLVLERIFRLCIDGYGLDRIAYILNTDGTPAFGNVGWTDNYVRKIITRRLVRGEMSIGEFVDDVRTDTGQTIIRYPVVIDEGTWQAANDALKARRRTGGQHTAKVVNLFGTICACQSCGGRMRVRLKGNSKLNSNYLQCSNAKRGLCSNVRYYNYDRLEPLILDWFGTIAYQFQDQSAEQIEMENAVATLKHEADLKAAEYKAAHRIARQNPGKLAEESLAEAEAEYEAKMRAISDLEKQVHQLKAQPRSEQYSRIAAMIADMPNLTGETRLQLRTKLNADLRKLVHKIIFKPEGGIDIQLFGPVGADRRQITVCEPPADSTPLLTAKEVMDAVRAGHQVGMSQ